MECEDFVKSIHAAGTRTRAALLGIWDDTGLDAQTRAEASQLLVQRISKVLENTVQEYQDANAKLRQEIAGLVTEHNDVKACLGALDDTTEAVYRCAFHLATDGLPLLLQRKRLTEAVSELRDLRSARLALFTQQHAELLALYDTLDTPLAERKPFAQQPAFVGADASHPLLRAYQQEIASCRAEKRVRNIARIKAVNDGIQILSLELEIPSSVEANSSLLLDMMKDEELEERVQALEAQLAALKERAQRQLTERISECSTRLQQLWRDYHDLTGHSLGSPLATEITESALRELQVLIAEAETRIREVGEAMGLLKRRDAILADEASMRAAQNDPSRLMSKSRGIAQQLLKEERTRKAIRMELPKINAQLRKFALDWRDRHNGEQFMYRGEVLLETIPAEAELPPQPASSGYGGGFCPPSPATSVLGKRKAEERLPLSPLSKRANFGARSASAMPVRVNPARSPSTCSVRANSTRSDSISSLYSMKSCYSQPPVRPFGASTASTPSKKDPKAPVMGTPSRIPAPPVFKTPSRPTSTPAVGLRRPTPMHNVPVGF